MALEAVGSSLTTHPNVLGRSQVGKARDFDSRIRRFESSRPSQFLYSFLLQKTFAGVAELADAPDLGSGEISCVGSSPSARTNSIYFFKGH